MGSGSAGVGTSGSWEKTVKEVIKNKEVIIFCIDLNLDELNLKLN